jgi:class 3 adenylate cyclase/HD superfamily phosphodiesterase
MKFTLNIRKTYILSIFLLLAFTAVFCRLNAQQFSSTKNNLIFSHFRYTFPNHLGIEKTYSISQNNLGILFFSTNKGIITFDGNGWNVVYFNQKALLANGTNSLFLFSKNFTGEIIRDPSGFYDVKELRTSYPETPWRPTDIASLGDTVCVVANNKTWLYYNKQFNLLSDKAGSLLINKGKIEQIREGKKAILLNGRFYEDNLPFEKTNLRQFNGNKFFSVFCSKNELILKTTNEDNEVRFPLTDTLIHTIFDRNNNLWILSNNTLNCIKHTNYYSPLVRLPLLKVPVKGIAKDSAGTFYIADNQNLFSSRSSTPIKKPNIQQVSFLDHNILISSNDGIFQLKGNKLILLVSRPVAYSTKLQDKFLFVSKGSLFSLRFNNNKVSIKELFNLKTDAIQKITGRKNGDLIILDKQNRIFLLHSIATGYSVEMLYSSTENYNTPFLDNIFTLNNEIYVSNSFNIHKLEGNTLLKNKFSPIDLPSKGYLIDYFEEDSAGNIIYSSGLPGENKRIFYGKNSGNSKLNWIELPIWEADLKNPTILGNFDNQIFLFEGGELIKLDLDKFFARSENVTLIAQQVLVNNKNTALHFSKKGIPYFEANYPVNLISMQFQAIDLTAPQNIQYSFRLDKKENGWSQWSHSPEKNFSNLPAGEYKLLVRAQSINGSISDVYAIHFKILPPFYLQWYAWIVYVLLFIGFIVLLGLNRKRQFEKEKITLERIIQERTSELMREKEKTDELLANMLPKDTADELKNTGKATSHKFDMVTVLFSDIQGFTRIAEQMNPEKLIDELDNFFFQFDSVVEKYNIEKIKTIGDAYMAAGGIPYKNRTNPVEVVLAALEMQEYMKTLKIKNSDIWDLRIGIHTGAVIAGVVGHKRISYDIWGDTVNTASRMESSGEASKINISGQTYELVKEFFVCEYRGKMPVKYKGDIDMYFVKGIRPELSVNLRSIPNKKFFVQLQLLRLQDLEEYVFDQLQTELPNHLLFHNLKHTKDVYTQTELIGRAENLNAEEMLLLRTAALLHDTGYAKSYQNPELKSMENCRKILPKFKYTEDQIETICTLIQCSQKNSKPNNKLEEILIDADLDYLGRVDYLNIALNHYREVKLNNGVRSEEDWFANQIKLLEEHEFYTETARKLREISRKEQIAQIKDYLKKGV